MNLYVTPGQLNGRLTAPPSRSYAHRYIICAALSRGTSIIHNFVPNDDLITTLEAMKVMGCEYSISGTELTITGTSAELINRLHFDCKNSLSTLRILIPISMVFSRDVIFTGTPELLEQGLSAFKEMFIKKGISVMQTSGEIHINGEFTPGRFEFPNTINRQYVSGMFFALPRLSKNSILRVKSPIDYRSYIDMTLDALKTSGVYISELLPGIFNIKGNQSYKGSDMTLEGDWVSGANLLCYNYIGSNVTVLGLNEESLQIDKDAVSLMDKLAEGNCSINISNYLDLGPLLFAMAAVKEGATFTGIRKLREKEPNRINSMIEELKAFNVKCIVSDDSIVVPKVQLKRPDMPVSSHNDSRIAMALTFLLSITGGIMSDAEIINNHYPAFYDDLSALGLKVHYKE
ncbi:MAG: hypothetical protein K5662_08845 [Lachnospiraceae bacterium]|nr:hypothetical protein [Lachnospiraceae bacterium]